MQYIIFMLSAVLVAVLCFMCAKKKLAISKNKYIQSVCYALLIAIVLEIGVFNFQHFQIMGANAPTQTFEVLTNQSSEEGDVAVNVTQASEKLHYEVTLNEINTQTKTLYIIPKSNADVIECGLEYADEMFSNTVGTNGGFKLVPGLDKSYYVPVHFVGNTKMLKFNFSADIDTPVNSLSITTNVAKPFDFSFLRAFIVLAIAFLALVIFQRNVGEKLIFSPNSPKQTIAVAVFLFLQIGLLLFYNYAPGIQYDENKQPVSVQEIDRGEGIYHTLTKAILEGRVNLNGIDVSAQAEAEGIAQLEQLDNPYDASQREGIYYHWDHAYYNGNYYCYFGIVPVLVFYLPYYLITGTFLSDSSINIIFLCLATIFLTGIIWHLAKRWKKPLPLLLVLGSAAAVVHSAVMLFCIPGRKFYEVAITSGLFFAFAGIYLLLRASYEKTHRMLKLALGSVCMALSVGCKPTFLLASLLIVPFVLDALLNPNYINGNLGKKAKFSKKLKAIFKKKNWLSLLAVLVPYVIIGALLMLYNFVRFDSPFNFGSEYQLTLADTGGYSLLDFSKIPTILVQSLFILPAFSSIFPYAHANHGNLNYLGFHYTTNYVGIYASPFMWLTAALPWAFKRGIKENRLRAFVMLAVISGIISCQIAGIMGGTSLRYSADFAWILSLLVVPVLFSIYEAAKEKNIGYHAFVVLMGLIILSVIMHNCIYISSNLSDLYLFDSIEKMVVFWK